MSDTKDPIVIKVIKYSLSLNGLALQYRHTQGHTILSWDPFATCALFEKLAWIQGFSTGQPEPIVLDLHERESQAWNQFVSSFTLSSGQALQIALFHYLKAHPHILQKAVTKISLPYKFVSPPLHLYTIHNYYYEHIRTGKNTNRPSNGQSLNGPEKV